MALLSLILLCAEYFIIRFALFDLHGMKEWPLCLFIGCVIAAVVSRFAGLKILPIAAAVSYAAGFAAGVIFHMEGADPGGGRTDNLWLIWTAVVVAAVVISGIAERVKAKKSGNGA